MAYREIAYPEEKGAFYRLLCDQMRLYTGGAPTPEAALANASAVLKAAFADANWVGFYLSDGRRLVLGPFQGRPAVMEIGFDQGVCGAAVLERRAQAVGDVRCFEGHIACDCGSRSELALPVFGPAGEILGVIDIDSPRLDRFVPEDARGMEEVARLLAPVFLECRRERQTGCPPSAAPHLT